LFGLRNVLFDEFRLLRIRFVGRTTGEAKLHEPSI
jgi:hypothetical protein